MGITKKILRAATEGKLLEKIYGKIKGFILQFPYKFFTIVFINTFNGTNRKALFKRIDRVIMYFAIRALAFKLPIDNNKILLCTSRGSYNCNPRAIADEILRQNLPWKMVWVARGENMKKIANLRQYPLPMKIVKRDSFEFYRELASSKVWIDNSINLYYMMAHKKKGQTLIETWHGSLGFKRFETTTDKKWIRLAKKCGRETDYILSDSKFEDNIFRKSFWKTTPILKYGHPRNDILLTDDKKRQKAMIKKVRKRFKIPDGVKLALYAPTFRDNKEDFYVYDIEYERLCKALSKRFGGEWWVLTRLHFTMRKKMKEMQSVLAKNWSQRVIDASRYEDIQDLMLAADVGITDYSSWICDFMFTRKPAFLYAKDLRNYYSERGFYYPLETAPFPIAETDGKLESNILKFDDTAYQKKINAFLKKMGCMEDGHAAERVVAKLKEIMGNPQPTERNQKAAVEVELSGALNEAPKALETVVETSRPKTPEAAPKEHTLKRDLTKAPKPKEEVKREARMVTQMPAKKRKKKRK